jgi:hypothetical protein
MSNRKDLASTYSSIVDRRGLIRHLVPFLRSEDDAKLMADYLDQVVKYKESMLSDDTMTNIERSYHDKGIPILNFFNKYGGLQGSIKKASGYRSKVINAEINQVNKFYKHLMQTDKERVSALKQTQSQLNKYIKQAKQEYILLKKSGGSAKELRLLAEQISNYKQTKEKEVNSKIRGYGKSGYEDSIDSNKKTLDKLKYKYDNSNLTHKQKNIIKQQWVNTKRELNKNIDKHDSFMNSGEAKKEFTIKNAGSFISDAVSTIASNPLAAAGMLRTAFTVLSRAVGLNPYVAGAILASIGFREFIAPKIFGSNKMQGFAPGTQVMGTNMTTGTQQLVTLPSALKGKSFTDTLINNTSAYIDRADANVRTFFGGTDAITKAFMYKNDGSGHLISTGIGRKDAESAIALWKSKGFDPALMAAVAKEESNFDLNAVGKTDPSDRGIFQFNKMRLEDLRQLPKYKNLSIDQLRKFGSASLYNSTMMWVDWNEKNNITNNKDILIPRKGKPIWNTREPFIKKVLSTWDQFRIANGQDAGTEPVSLVNSGSDLIAVTKDSKIPDSNFYRSDRGTAADDFVAKTTYKDIMKEDIKSNANEKAKNINKTDKQSGDAALTPQISSNIKQIAIEKA